MFEYLKKHKIRSAILIAAVIILLLLLLDFSRFMSIINWLSGVFQPLVIGGCIAFVLNLLMDGLDKLIFNRIHFKKESLKDALSLLTSVILLIIIIVVLLWFVIPQMIQSFRLLVESVPSALEYLRNLLGGFLSRYPEIERNLQQLPVTGDELIKNIVNYLQQFASSAFNHTYNVFTNTIGVVFTIFVGLMFSFFLLTYKDKLGRQCRQLLFTYLPEDYANETLYIFHLAYKNFNAFIYGQIIGALIQFGLYLAIALIFRIPYAFMIAVMIGIFSLIPMFGSYIAFAIGALLILSVDPIKAIYFSVIFFIVCNLEGNVIYPRIVGSTLGLPGIWVLAAVTIGANMFGIVGMIFSVPIFALIYTLISENSQKRLRNKPDVIDRITEPPNWEYYNYQTRKFEKKPVVIKNVLNEKDDK